MNYFIQKTGKFINIIFLDGYACCMAVTAIRKQKRSALLNSLINIKTRNASTGAFAHTFIQTNDKCRTAEKVDKTRGYNADNARMPFIPSPRATRAVRKRMEVPELPR